MKRAEQRLRPAERYDHLVEWTCDLCGADMFKVTEPEPFEFSEAKVEAASGCRYPEGGSAEHVEFDICHLCFMTKLVPWLKSQGAVPRYYETDNW